MNIMVDYTIVKNEKQTDVACSQSTQKCSNNTKAQMTEL